MKFAKIYSIAAIAALAVAAMGCSEVTDPVYHDPNAADFKLNTPPLQDQYFELTENGTFEITANGQPDYGFSAITQYRAQVSLTEDFAQFEELTPTGTGTLSRMTFKSSDLAMAMCTLHGITNEDNYVDYGYEKVYFRGVAFINGIESSFVTTSNVVSLNNVKAYFAVPQPAYIYCIGNAETDWIGPDEANAEALRPYRVSEKEDQIGSMVFYASIDFGTNAPIFRFYTGLNGWDRPADFTPGSGLAAFFSLGAAGGTDSDTPVVFDELMPGETLTHGLAETKDSFSFPNITGVVDMTVDLTNISAPTAHFTTH